MENKSYVGKIKTSLWWWLGTNRPFILEDQFKIELLFIDNKNGSAKIQITNIKTGQVLTQEAEDANT